MLQTSCVRKKFLDYFHRNGHTIVSSSSLIPHNDKTLLFTNAGMVQFKDVFIGLEKREYNRATTAQKCVRAGGKHNDLDQVGFTSRHHTFFEMLGNFSFGDYFKAEAIEFAWNFLTKELCIDKSRLLATVYHTDDEAKELWRKIAGEDFTIIPIKTNDNFWSMGDSGPCGPCTEIFFDHGPNVFGGIPGSKDENGDRFVEIWNIVFMQFEQLIDGSRTDLKAKSIDTGIGLERLAAVLQGKQDNYDIDLFQSIIADIQNISGIEMNDRNRPSFKVISDHLRSLSFLISDGIFPSNEGRGYVLRRILRRAVRHANSLGINGSFIYKLVPSLVNAMGDAYQELNTMRTTIESTIKTEEEKFLSTLGNGLTILNNEIVNLPEHGTLSGDIAFKLYDTYGFPLDLTQDILRSKNMTVDEKGFDEAMQEQKNRANWKNSTYDKTHEAVFFDIAAVNSCQEFVGYESLKSTAKITAIVSDGRSVESVSNDPNNACISIITNKTPFYAECGGQVGDIGKIKKHLGTFCVTSTRKVGNLAIHDGYIENGSFSVNENVELQVNEDYRKNTMRHHTATHLLQSALKHVLGSHIAQKGSYVCPDYLRFDFSHNVAMTTDELNEVEKLVNSFVLSNFCVSKCIMKKEEAIKSGATALFGEKYDSNVRVVSVADEVGHIISSELCGGTHVCSTGEIGLFKIISENSIGSGLRRIEAVAGTALLKYINNTRQLLDNINIKMKSSDNDVLQKLESTLEEVKALSSDKLRLTIDFAIANASYERINNFTVATCITSNINPKDLRIVADRLLKEDAQTIVLLYNKNTDNRLNVVVVNSRKLGKAKLVLEAALQPLNGHGGGKDDFAQGGSSNSDKLNISLEKAKQLIRNL